MKSAKYCISLRGKEIQKYQCVCGKIFTRSYTLKLHVSKCVAKINHDRNTEEYESSKEKLLSELEETKQKLADTDQTLSAEIELLHKQKNAVEKRLQKALTDLQKVTDELQKTSLELQETSEELDAFKIQAAEGRGQIKVYKERPGTINNTQYINPKLVNIKCETIHPLTLEYVKQEVEEGKYSYENYIRGEKGLVDFISALISEDDQRSYVCTDAARNKFHRLIETREWKEDNGANFLNNIFDSLKDPATLYYGKVTNMLKAPDEQETGDFLMGRTKRMFFGITSPKSKDREELFNKIRTEVRKLAAV